MENNKHYSEQSGHRLRGLFAKRQKVIAHLLTDLELTYGVDNEQDSVVHYTLPKEAFEADEADQLLRRGVVFPLEVAEPSRVTFECEANIFRTSLHGLAEPLNEHVEKV